MARNHGHYCKVCGEYKSNESFSGSGHAAHICKKCAALPAAQRSETMILTKLWNLPWQLSAQQRDWLKGLQNDSRPEVASTAKELYADRFPYAARNARKKQLQIAHMEFAICGEVIDEYGDVCCEDIQFTLDRKEHTVTLRQGDEVAQITLTEKNMRRLLNVIVNSYEVFCWEDDYGFSNAADTDALWEDEQEAETPDEAVPEEPEYEDTPSWTVSVRYTNGEAQEMRGYDDLPDRVNELALELLALFEDESDMEHRLSVIENPQPHGKSYNKWLGGNAKPCQRDLLRAAIDAALAKNPKDFETFLKPVEAAGYTVKRGKHITFMRDGQPQNIRLRSLGEGYSEEELLDVILGTRVHTPRRKKLYSSKTARPALISQIEAKIGSGKGAAYDRKLKVVKLKSMAETLLFIQKHDFVDFDALSDYGKDLCTLVTCTPYGINSHRLLVRGHRVENADDAAAIRVTSDAIRIESVIVAPFVAMPFLFILLLVLLFGGKKKETRGGGNHGKRNKRD